MLPSSSFTSIGEISRTKSRSLSLATVTIVSRFQFQMLETLTARIAKLLCLILESLELSAYCAEFGRERFNDFCLFPCFSICRHFFHFQFLSLDCISCNFFAGSPTLLLPERWPFVFFQCRLVRDPASKRCINCTNRRLLLQTL